MLKYIKIKLNNMINFVHKKTLKIYKHSKNPMQSGGREYWVAEILNNNDEYYIEPVMGWVGSREMEEQIKLNFTTKEQAIEYAKNNYYNFIIEPEEIVFPPKRKSYSDNFKK